MKDRDLDARKRIITEPFRANSGPCRYRADEGVRPYANHVGPDALVRAARKARKVSQLRPHSGMQEPLSSCILKCTACRLPSPC
jgi:hypothetical protein